MSLYVPKGTYCTVKLNSFLNLLKHQVHPIGKIYDMKYAVLQKSNPAFQK